VPEFVPASRLYDVESGERVLWDWDNGQPLQESQAAVEQAVQEVAGGESR